MPVIWKEANLGALLPPGTLELIDTIQSVLDIFTPMLQTVANGLDAASSFIASWPVFDFAAMLGELIAKWKNDFLMTGLYMLPLWDYPAKQLRQSSSYGPDRLFGVLNYAGTTFQDLVEDITRSMLALKDANRPRFNFDCAMLALFMAYPTIGECSITLEDGSANAVFPGLKDLTGAAHGIRELRWQGAWRKLRDAVAQSPPDQAEARILEVVEAQELFSTFDRDEIGSIPIPGDDIGDPFYEKALAKDISWSMIQSTTSAVQFSYEPLEYPCWSRVNMTDLIPGLQSLADAVFDPIIAALKSAKNLQQVILDLIDAIKKRVDALLNILAQVDYILEQLEAMLKATGFYAVFINSTTGTAGLLEQLQASEHPFMDEQGRPVKMFFAGTVLVAGGPPITAFRLLMAPVAGV